MPAKKLNKFIKEQLELKLQKILSEQFFQECHENLLPGTYHFNFRFTGDCPDCAITTAMKTNVIVTIDKTGQIGVKH